MKLASTILVLRPSAAPSTRYLVLMVRRSGRARFMAGAHVFPGGIAEEADRDPELWQRMGLPRTDSSAEEALPRRLGAIRELFEETGVLLSDPPLASLAPRPREYVAAMLRERRGRVRKDPREFAALFEHFRAGGGADAAGAPALRKLRPAVDALLDWSRWVTPLEERYRYDTRFFVAVLDPREPVDVAAADLDETTAVDWLEPEDAIAKHSRGEILLPPPTYLTMRELAAVRGGADAVAALARAGRDLAPILPRIVPAEGGAVAICLPGDREHPDSLASGRLRRLLMASGSTYSYFDTRECKL